MSGHLREICIRAIQNDERISEAVKKKVDAITNIEIHRFDSSYLEFLESQIELSPRGPEWAERLKKRMKNISEYTDQELARCSLDDSNERFAFEIDPITQTVIHWEN